MRNEVHKKYAEACDDLQNKDNIMQKENEIAKDWLAIEDRGCPKVSESGETTRRIIRAVQFRRSERRRAMKAKGSTGER